MKKIYYILLFTLCFNYSYSQVGINTNTPATSAMLDINSLSKGMSFPNVYLQSLTDVTTVTAPKESLVVFNTNENLNAGEGIYYWDGIKWVFLFSEANQGLLENLVKYYTKKDNLGYNFNFSPSSSPSTDDFYGENTNHSSVGDNLHTEWTVVSGLTTNIMIDRAVNDELYTISGMMQADNDTNTGHISTSIGVFVDNKLVAIKPLVMSFEEIDCTYREFTIMVTSKNLPVGNHMVKFAIRNRGGDLGTDTEINLTYGKKNPYSSCNNTLNDDETRMNASILINQPYNF